MMAGALSSLAVVLFQESSNGGGHDTHRGALFLGVIAVCMILQAAAVAGVAIVAFVLSKKIEKIADNFEAKTSPIIAKTTALVTELEPKVRSIVTNAEQVSFTARAKVDELATTLDHLNRTVQDINERSRVQVSRVDGIVSDALATTYEVSRTVQESIKGPVKQVAGVIAGLKTGLETLIARSPFGGGGGPVNRETNPYDL